MDDKIIDLFGSNKSRKKRQRPTKPAPTSVAEDDEPQFDVDYEQPLVVMDHVPDGADLDYSLQWWESQYPNYGEIGWQIKRLQTRAWMSSVVSAKRKLRASHLPLNSYDTAQPNGEAATFAFFALVLLHDAKLAPNKVDAEVYMSFVLEIGHYHMSIADADRVYHLSAMLPKCFSDGGRGELIVKPYDDEDDD